MYNFAKHTRQQPLKYCDMIYELKDQKLNNTEYE